MSGFKWSWNQITNLLLNASPGFGEFELKIEVQVLYITQQHINDLGNQHQIPCKVLDACCFGNHLCNPNFILGFKTQEQIDLIGFPQFLMHTDAKNKWSSDYNSFEK